MSRDSDDRSGALYIGVFLDMIGDRSETRASECRWWCFHLQSIHLSVDRIARDDLLVL